MPALDAMSNVRNVLAQLSDTTPRGTQAMPKVAAPAAKITPPAAKGAPAAMPPPPARPEITAVPAAPVAAAPVQAPTSLNAAQTLEVLEPGSTLKADAPLQFADEGEEDQVRVITPEDTQTLTDIRLDAQKNAPPCFAVQLVWSVTPIDITKQAHLAIFDAYTLYNVEGNRQGRRWYGLRLGFFSDPNSATQVAYYVRSDYPKVAVVPVATRERERAGGTKGAAATPKARLGEPSSALKPETQTAIEKQGLDGFELLKDDRPAAVKRDVDDVDSSRENHGSCGDCRRDGARQSSRPRLVRSPPRLRASQRASAWWRGHVRRNSSSPMRRGPRRRWNPRWKSWGPRR